MVRARGGPDGRCPRCKINMGLCFCDHIKSYDSSAKVSIIMHISEKKLTSNTAWLTQLILNNCDIHVRGEVYNKFDGHDVIDIDYTPLFLYPSEESIPLTKEYVKTLSKPVQLIVPDGNWHQARKVKAREEAFKNIQAVHLNSLNESIYSLRTPPFKGAVCTLEAIAHALNECNEEIASKALLNSLEVMVERTHMARAGYNHLRSK